MPIQSCMKNGRPGFKYGDAGACYVYTPGDAESKKAAKAKAAKQGVAIERNRGGKLHT